MNKSVYHIRLKDISGQDIELKNYKGKKLLFVNVASECGFTPQYAQLQDLYRHYKEKIMVIGCPCNDFGAQEPGSEEEIIRFCERNFQVSFLTTEKLKILKDPHPLYFYLTKKSANGALNSEVRWNFHKFLVDENGFLINSYPSAISPLDDVILDHIAD